jgi:predicted phosphodiesterase
MRFAVISDIHANREAFEAVLADIRRWQPDKVYCLGDVIGYGPSPRAVIDLMGQNAILSVRGNHELAVLKPRFLKWFNPVARGSIEKTTGLLRPKDMDAISRFPPMISAHGCRFVHGFPPRSSLLYQFQVADPKKCRIMARLPESICFVGHTHTLELISIEGDRINHLELGEDDYRLDRNQQHIINIGSVGQPRDGNLQAKYVLFTPRDYRLKVCFVDYDAQATVDRMRQDGWPEQHALRLLPRPACS